MGWEGNEWDLFLSSPLRSLLSSPLLLQTTAASMNRGLNSSKQNLKLISSKSQSIQVRGFCQSSIHLEETSTTSTSSLPSLSSRLSSVRPTITQKPSSSKSNSNRASTPSRKAEAEAEASSTSSSSPKQRRPSSSSSSSSSNSISPLSSFRLPSSLQPSTPWNSILHSITLSTSGSIGLLSPPTYPPTSPSTKGDPYPDLPSRPLRRGERSLRINPLNRRIQSNVRVQRNISPTTLKNDKGGSLFGLERRCREKQHDELLGGDYERFQKGYLLGLRNGEKENWLTQAESAVSGNEDLSPEGRKWLLEVIESRLKGVGANGTEKEVQVEGKKKDEKVKGKSAESKGKVNSKKSK